MKKEIVVLDSDPNKGNDVDKLLANLPFHIIYVRTLAECETTLQQRSCCAVIMDLDTVDIDNRTIAHFKRNHPKVNILAKSTRKFHPELEESLRSHIFACLTKPIDPIELQFWMRSLPSPNGSS